jgi:hypothetical protein
MRPITLCLLVLLIPNAHANSWTKLDRATISGQRWDIPLGYSPELKRFIILGGRTSWAEYKKPRPYDVLTLNPKTHEWENNFPEGKDWGSMTGACKAPAWKGEYWEFRDIDGNIRPNWTVYGTFSLGQKYDYDPDTKCFYFHARGKTFRYDPAAREWTDLAPKATPESALGGNLLWSSMCYDRHNKQFILFGGGNIQSERGDPGTWTYSPSANVWKKLDLDVQPPQRANSRLVYDPVHKKVILFGGDQLDQLIADTWAFDVVKSKWEQLRPKLSPTPRAAHAMLWLPKAKKVLLLGGYGYTSTTDYVASLYKTLPLEAWTFDPATGEWQLVERFERSKSPDGPVNFFFSAAVDDDDTVVVLGADRSTWMCKFDVSKVDGEATAKSGVAPGTVVRRTDSHDPAWYKRDVPPVDAAKVAAELKALPANEWVKRPTPKMPRMNMDWGSAVFAPDLDMIIRFSGGHSAYSGTAPQVYDVKTDRYTIPFAPEYPIEYVYSNDQVHGEWSFKGNPWMTGHTYKSTGYDPHLKSLLFTAHEYSYSFDPLKGKWTRFTERNPWKPNMYIVTVCATPEGAVVWGDRRGGNEALWRLDGETRTRKSLPLKGTLPSKSPDHHGLAHDSKRDRLLFFSDHGEHRGDVAEYDFKTGQARWLNPAGKSKALVPSRETAYVAGADLVLIGSRVKVDERFLWLAYDCTKNAWVGLELGGADPIGKGVFNNSMGLMFDPNRKLVWAVGQHSQVHVLRLDLSTVKVTELK